MTWRHLNFWQYRTYIHASVPRVGDAEHSPRRGPVPWARVWVMHSRLNYFDQRYTNAILDGLNNIIQNIKCRARGFRNANYFATMIYLVIGDVDLDSVLVRC